MIIFFHKQKSCSKNYIRIQVEDPVYAGLDKPTLFLQLKKRAQNQHERNQINIRNMAKFNCEDIRVRFVLEENLQETLWAFVGIITFLLECRNSKCRVDSTETVRLWSKAKFWIGCCCIWWKNVYQNKSYYQSQEHEWQ